MGASRARERGESTVIAPVPITPQIIRFPTAMPLGDFPFAQGEKVTLRKWYDRMVLPEIRAEQAKRSLAEDRVALNRWEDFTRDPDIREVEREDVEHFRDGMLRKGLSPHTANKYWRELKAVFKDAEEQDFIRRAPAISRRRKSSLIRIRAPKIHRPTVTMEEVDLLWRGCQFATYPENAPFSAPQLWRVALVLFYTYGARTLDILHQLEWENISWGDRLVKFQAMKTSKLQGLPMTATVADHLRSIQTSGGKVFSGFRSAGHRSRQTGKWKRGYYTTWRNEIVRAAELDGLNFKHFRESMVTRYNAIEKHGGGLGSWIAGHFVPGVSAQNYEYPTQAIRDAIEAAPVPPCFRFTA